MCGIAGFTGPSATARNAPSILDAMCRAIEHRGPDDQGTRIFPGAALGMRRLSIIDVGGGMQPIANEDDSVHVVFNGEIYNHAALQRQLESRGHRFATHCDTEVLVHLYEEFGDRLLDHISGMYAFAIWDAKARRLLIARDRFGIKPLYYRADSEGITFGSELRVFLAADAETPALESTAVAYYLSLGYVPDPLSIFRGIRKLPAGHLLLWQEGAEVEVRRYWSPVPRVDSAPVDERELIEELRELLRCAVESHLESEVPLGAFLSGGIDSSTVVALMAAAMGQRVSTFSIGFDEREYNEAPDARFVADAFGTDHHELIVKPDVDTLVDDVIQCFDEPFADSSALPTFLVSRLARERVTVALSGDGGDELFGGYTRYADALRRMELQPSARRMIGAVARLVPPAAPGRNRLLDLARTRQGRYAASVALPLPVAEGGVARASLAERIAPLDGLLAPHFGEVADRDFASQMMAVDIATYLPGDILTKVDRTSMAVSLETRVPLLDHRLAEFVLRLPSSSKLRDGTGKHILRRAVADLLPENVLRKPKQGFALPLGRWLRNELRYRVEELLQPGARIYEFVDPRAVHRTATEHRFGRRDHSVTLWRLLVLESWLSALGAGGLSRPPRVMRDVSAGQVDLSISG